MLSWPIFQALSSTDDQNFQNYILTELAFLACEKWLIFKEIPKMEMDGISQNSALYLHFVSTAWLESFECV